MGDSVRLGEVPGGHICSSRYTVGDTECHRSEPKRLVSEAGGGLIAGHRWGHATPEVRNRSDRLPGLRDWDRGVVALALLVLLGRDASAFAGARSARESDSAQRMLANDDREARKRVGDCRLLPPNDSDGG
jgi:hypothetical protein